MKSNPIPNDKSLPTLKIPRVEQYLEMFLQSKKLHMVWGDVGTGKTTYALQLAKTCLKHNKKVFFLNSKPLSQQSLFQRLLFSDPSINSANFLHWNCETFSQQKKLIFQWTHNLHKINLFPKGIQKVGLIIVDEIASLYLLEQYQTHDSKKNVNQDLMFIMASLGKIIQNFQIPVLIINRFKLKRDETNINSQIISPFGGNFIKYWFLPSSPISGIELRVSRTSTPSKYQFQLVNPHEIKGFKSLWTWKLGTQGFL